MISQWQAALVTSAADVIEFLSPAGASVALAGPPVFPLSRRNVPPAVDRDVLDLESATILDALPRRGGMGTSRVAQRAGLPPATAVRCLGGLAAAGFVERCPEGWRLRRA